MVNVRKRLAGVLATRQQQPPHDTRRPRSQEEDRNPPICNGPAGNWIATATDRARGASLLIRLCGLLEKLGIRSIDDSRVAPEVRRLWECLIDSEALNAVSDKDVERVWRIIRVNRRMVLCGTEVPVSLDRIGIADRKRERETTPKG